eukprot:s963_g44.t1
MPVDSTFTAQDLVDQDLMQRVAQLAAATPHGKCSEQRLQELIVEAKRQRIAHQMAGQPTVVLEVGTASIAGRSAASGNAQNTQGGWDVDYRGDAPTLQRLGNKMYTAMAGKPRNMAKK